VVLTVVVDQTVERVGETDKFLGTVYYREKVHNFINSSPNISQNHLYDGETITYDNATEK
jgi:hypothetical protein